MSRTMIPSPRNVYGSAHPMTVGMRGSVRVAEASLKRLRVEAIDLFYQHRVDPNVPKAGRGGATIDVTSRRPEGTRFVVQLPRRGTA